MIGSVQAYSDGGKAPEPKKKPIGEPAPKRTVLQYLFRQAVDRESFDDFCEDTIKLLGSKDAKTGASLPTEHFNLVDKIADIAYRTAYHQVGQTPLPELPQRMIRQRRAKIAELIVHLPETPVGYVTTEAELSQATD